MKDCRKAMPKPFIRNKKAVSPAISSVIMSAAIITVGLIVLAWANNSFLERQQESSQFFQTQNQLISENFVIEDVWFYPNGVNVTVRNVGTISMTVSAVRFNGTNHLDTPISAGICQARTVVLDWNWGTGTHHYIIQVETQRKQSIAQTFCTTG